MTGAAGFPEWATAGLCGPATRPIVAAPADVWRENPWFLARFARIVPRICAICALGPGHARLRERRRLCASNTSGALLYLSVTKSCYSRNFGACSGAMAFLVSSQATESDPGGPATHPLDPLSAAEIEGAAEAVKVKQGLGPSARFVYISLYEPAKADVIAFEQGGPAPARLVKVVVRERAERATYEAIVRCRRRGRLLEEGPRRAAVGDVRGVPRRRGRRPRGPALAGGHAQAGRHRLRPVHDRPLVLAERRARTRAGRRPLRPPADLGPLGAGRQRLRAAGRERGRPWSTWTR